MLPVGHTLLTACGNHHFQTIFKSLSQLPSLSPRHGFLRSTLQTHFSLTKYCELTRLCSWANVSRFAPEFWWQLMGSCVLRHPSISVQIRALLPATCTKWFVSKCINILLPNFWFGYRCRSSSRHSYSSACAAHPACNLGIRIMPIEAQSFDLFRELSDNYKCCKTPDYKYSMPTLVKEITVLQRMDWWSLHLLLLAKFYNRVCSAIMFTPLISIINRSQTVMSLNALCTLGFGTTIRRALALAAISSWHSLDSNIMGAFISELSPTANTYTWRCQAPSCVGILWLWWSL